MAMLSERVQGIINSNVPEHLRDYITRMVAKESGGREDLRSTTGARGLLQFTEGTGKLYGLLGKDFDIRNDPVANIKAGVKLTQDNWNTLKGFLGRDPSHSELALGHQQGAETAAKMLTGTGNAKGSNLVANNIPANTPPQEAARKIMNYYGFDKKPGMQVPGMSLAYNPLLPQLQNPMPTALPAGVPAMPGAQGTPPMLPDQASPVAAAATAGAPGQGGIGGLISSLLNPPAPAAGQPAQPSALDQTVGAINPKVNPAVAAEAAKISPMSGGSLEAGGGGMGPQAQSLMAQLMAARRKNMGLTLTGR